MWLLAILLAPAFAHANGASYTIDARMLPCETHLIFYPKITTDPGSEHGGSFGVRIVSESDRNTPFTAQRTFAKALTKVDRWGAITDDYAKFIDIVQPYIDVDWGALTNPHLQVYSSEQSEVGWFPIPSYEPVSFSGGNGSSATPRLPPGWDPQRRYDRDAHPGAVPSCRA